MFGFGEKKFLGIDIGTSSIKMVELKIEDNRPVLSNYAWMKSGEHAGGKDGYFENVLPAQLKRMIKEAGFRASKAYLSIPPFGGLITVIDFPEMEEEDLEQAIKFEAHKYIPVPLEDIVLSWEVIKDKTPPVLEARKGEGDEKPVKRPVVKTQVLLVAAQKNQVSKYERIAKDAGLNLASIELESFPLIRSLIGNDQGNFLIVDIGHRVCNIMLVEKGIIMVNRNIDAGGRDITRAISRSMNIDDARAESLKISGKNFLDIESGMSFPVIDMIIKEVSRVLNLRYGNNSQSSVDGIVLSGGTASFSGIEEYFFKNLNIKTTIGNPFGRVQYDKRLEPAIRSMGSRFAVAMGLALGGANEYFKNKK